MCKCFVLAINSLSDNGKDKAYRSGSKPKHKPEKTRLYEIVSLLGTAKVVISRKFANQTVVNVKSRLKTKLKDAKLKKS